MRFASLGSGSRGNATLVECNGACLMLDCGFSAKEAASRLARLGKEGDTLTAILLTHEHADHADGAGVVARRFGLPVWMTAGTWRRVRNRIGPLPEINLINIHNTFEIGDLQIEPFPVPHDACEPSQFVFSTGHCRLGVLTDTGGSTAHIEKMLDACDALLLECNHDLDMLWNGPYPQSLKERVGGPYGHLDNATAARILSRIDQSRLQHVVAAHLSEKNNTRELARAALGEALGCGPEWIGVAGQDEGLAWREVY